VVGELANVYRAQKKTSDYLSTNTKFVERLVKNNRFSEAWDVVKVTSQVDQNIAEQQRRLIMRAQEKD
ncbi:MAG: hypothetical protein OQL19_15570, partial [Gammaproteobacteria bacterium]|nr:hypothetical protein [Gammaproteobacteria bacterium]